MNSISQDAQTRRPDAAPAIDQPLRDARLPERIDVPDPTEDLANDVTSELPGASTRLHVVPNRLIGTEVIVANDETTDVAPAMATGMVLRDRYILGPPIGYGGTSVVYQAHYVRRVEVPGANAEVAIKLLQPEFRDQPQCIARLRREFHQTQSLAHPGVVRFHDLDCDRGTWFIAMERLFGETLGRRLRHESPAGLPTTEALHIAMACGEALAHAHARGVTHGDVKPDNVFVTVSGEVRMLDFGVAPDSGEAPLLEVLAVAEPVHGAATRAYASPEVLSGQSPESRDDVFSLACLIYEMLAGKHPYGRRGADEALAEGLELERLPGISVQQWRAIASSLAWKRADRPEIRDMLDLLGNDAPAPPPTPVQARVEEAAAPPVPVVEGRLLHRQRWRWLGFVFIGLAVVLGVLIGRFAFVSPGVSRSGDTGQLPTGGTTTAISPIGDLTPAVDTDALARPLPGIEQAAAAPAVEPKVQNPLVPGLVFFDAPGMVVSKRAVVAAIPMRHLSRVKRAVNVNWRLIEGTARAGRDYGGPESGVESFVAGNSFRMLYVPILANPGSMRDRKFTVELTSASPGAELGPTTRVVVTILGDS